MIKHVVPSLLTVKRAPLPDIKHAHWSDVASIASRMVQGAPLPPEVDLSHYFPAARDQLNLGACTAFASTDAASFANSVEGRYTTYSALFQYYQERVLNGTVQQDSGATIQESVQALETVGVVAESLYPYVPADFTAAPPASVSAQAQKVASSNFTYLGQTGFASPAQAALAAGQIVLFGFDVYPGLMPAMVPGNATCLTGELPMPNAFANALIGGHANLLVGYATSQYGTRFLVRNQWGQGWGRSGYYWMPAEYLDLHGFDGYAVGPSASAQINRPVFVVPDLSAYQNPDVSLLCVGGNNTNATEVFPLGSGVSLMASASTSGDVAWGQKLTVNLQTGVALPAGWRPWLLYSLHPNEMDAANVGGWTEPFPFIPIATSPTSWSVSFSPSSPLPPNSYSFLAVRILPPGVTPDALGNPEYDGDGKPLPQVSVNWGGIFTGSPNYTPHPEVPQITALSTQDAPASTDITVTGSGFSSATRAVFTNSGGTNLEAAAVEWGGSDSTIKVTLPDAAGIYTLRLYNVASSASEYAGAAVRVPNGYGYAPLPPLPLSVMGPSCVVNVSAAVPIPKPVPQPEPTPAPKPSVVPKPEGVPVEVVWEGTPLVNGGVIWEGHTWVLATDVCAVEGLKASWNGKVVTVK